MKAERGSIKRCFAVEHSPGVADILGVVVDYGVWLNFCLRLGAVEDMVEAGHVLNYGVVALVNGWENAFVREVFLKLENGFCLENLITHAAFKEGYDGVCLGEFIFSGVEKSGE